MVYLQRNKTLYCQSGQKQEHHQSHLCQLLQEHTSELINGGHIENQAGKKH